MRINRKSMVPYPTTATFFVVSKVRRQFSQGIFTVTIIHVVDDEGESLWHAVYPDYDSEDLNFNEVIDAVYYSSTVLSPVARHDL